LTGRIGANQGIPFSARTIDVFSSSWYCVSQPPIGASVIYPSSNQHAQVISIVSGNFVHFRDERGCGTNLTNFAKESKSENFQKHQKCSL
jgi:hypothetical protein